MSSKTHLTIHLILCMLCFKYRKKLLVKFGDEIKQLVFDASRDSIAKYIQEQG